MALFASLRKRNAIKSYVRRLGKDLARRYGKSKTYTPEQVVRTVREAGYNWLHICYAHSLYVSHKAFDRWHEEQGEDCDYESMRAEISDSGFAGNAGSLDAGGLGDDIDSSHGGSDLGSD